MNVPIPTSFVKSPTINTTVLHDQSPHLVNNSAISACWGPTGMWFAIHWCATIFETVLPFLLCDAHGSVPENLLNFPNGFRWVAPSFCQNFMQYRWLKLFRHFASHTRILQAKKNSRMCRNVPYTFPLNDSTRTSFAYAKKKKDLILFE